LSQVKNGLIVNEPLAEVDRLVYNTGFVNQNIDYHFSAGRDDGFLLHGVGDQVGTVDLGVLDEGRIDNAIEEEA